MKPLMDQFDRLCQQAQSVFGEEGERSYEATLIDILNFVKRHPQCRAGFVERFKLILNVGNAPFEAVAFCMRELQWFELRDYVSAVLQSSVDPRSQALTSVLSAYDEVWPDADLYRYYGRQS